MRIGVKFNLVLLGAFSLALVLAAYFSREILLSNAQEEVSVNAHMMMQMARGVRAYTAEQIRPVLNRHQSDDFLPQSVPAFAATDNMNRLAEAFPDFVYKEAALNPTNRDHLATTWEKDVIEYFRANPEEQEYILEREGESGRTLHLTRPLRVTSQACLECHSTPERAPESMIRLYGPSNGFGWRHNDIIGAQIVSVPMTVPISRANNAFTTFMLALTGVFVALGVVLNLLLHRIVIAPVKVMSEKATQISLGDLTTPEFSAKGKDEIASLGASFNRMYRSLVSALKMLDE